MPFDGTGYEGRIELLDKIDKVIDLLGDERRWCKRQLQSRDGRRCILGAMMAADATAALKKPILLAIEQVTGRDHCRIERFNDRPQTTHAQVITVLHKARENIVDGAVAPRLVEQSTGPWARLHRLVRFGR